MHRFARVVVVLAIEVKHAMDQEVSQMMSQGAALGGGFPPDDAESQNDIAAGAGIGWLLG